MLKPLIACSAIALCLAASALAQSNPPTPAPMPTGASVQGANLPPVDSMTCPQMLTEITADGQVMRGQIDPQFGVEAQAMQQDAQQKQREAMQQAMTPNPTCFIPFMAMACAAHQQQRQQQSMQEATANQQRVTAQMNRLNDSTAGLDQARMQALNTRFQSQNCQAQMPNQGQPSH